MESLTCSIVRSSEDGSYALEGGDGDRYLCRWCHLSAVLVIPAWVADGEKESSPSDFKSPANRRSQEGGTGTTESDWYRCHRLILTASRISIQLELYADPLTVSNSDSYSFR